MSITCTVNAIGGTVTLSSASFHTPIVPGVTQVQSGEEIKYRFDIDSSHRIPVKDDPAEYVLQFTDNDNYVHNVKNFTTAGTTYYENTTTVPSSKNGVIHFELNAVPVAPPVVKRTLNFYQNGATATANGQSLAQPKQFDDGTEVDIVVTPASGYQFKTITTKKGTVVTPITITDIKAPVSFKLTMDADTDITVQVEQIPVAPAVKHNLTVNHDANSNVTASGTTVTNGAILPYDENTAVPIVVSPKTGYEITKIEYIKGGTTTTVPISNSQGANSFSIVLDGDCTLNVTSALHVEMIDIKLDNQSGDLKITLNGTEYTTTTTVKVPENTVLNFKVEVVKPHLHFVGDIEFADDTGNSQKFTPQTPTEATFSFTARYGGELIARTNIIQTVPYVEHFNNVTSNLTGQTTISTYEQDIIFTADQGYDLDATGYWENTIDGIQHQFATQGGSTFTLTVTPQSPRFEVHLTASKKATVTGNAFLNLYKCTDPILREIAAIRFQSSVVVDNGITQITENNDLGQYITGLYVLPYIVDPVYFPTQSNVKLGNYQTSIETDQFDNYVIELDFGEITFDEKYQNFIDYESRITLRLPWYGEYLLDTAYCMNRVVKVLYRTNLYTQSTTILISNEDGVFQTIETNIVSSLPFLQTSNDTLIGQYASTVLNGIREVSAIVERAIPVPDPQGYSTIYKGQLNTLTGYVEASSIDLTSSKIKDKHKKEIELLLSQGIEIN